MENLEKVSCEVEDFEHLEEKWKLWSKAEIPSLYQLSDTKTKEMWSGVDYPIFFYELY